MNDNELGLLTSKQLSALRCACEENLIRIGGGWWSLKYLLQFQSSTIRSLWWRELLDANFDDRRGFGSHPEAEQLASCVHGGRLTVRTSEAGRILLRSYDAWRDKQPNALAA